MKYVEIFTDGSCLGNPGVGGWAALLRYQQKEKSLSGSERHTTNNRMELWAAIAAFRELKEPCIIKLSTDSIYLKKGVTEYLPRWKKNNWKTSAKKPVKNIDLWQQLEQETERHQITWEWVKAHATHLENIRVDALARAASKQEKTKL